jgi:hypothetical protein
MSDEHGPDDAGLAHSRWLGERIRERQQAKASPLLTALGVVSEPEAEPEQTTEPPQDAA